MAAKYADDKKSVILTSDTSLAAGTYTVTVGSFAPVSFNVTKQTPTTLKIVNTTVANQANARVYFQVLDQYNDVMENYTDRKLTVSAYNVTKGHAITKEAQAKKADYFTLNCSTETTAPSGGFLNSIGDKVSVVAYLTDNAAVSCTAELEIVRIYTNELSFGDVKLGDDKRVIKNRTYELEYTAKDTEGKAVTFDEKAVGKNDDALKTAATDSTVIINNYNFISSNSSAVNMKNVSVDADGKLKFVAGNTPGTAVITAINTITGETASTTIVVNAPAQLSSLDIADASVACDAKPGDKFKALVTAYDQFGEVIDAKNVKNVSLKKADGTLGNDLFFNSITATPDGTIGLNKITSDGKYVEYVVLATPGTTRKGQNVTFNFISKEMGDTGYIKSSSVVTIDDEIEASALEIVKAPAETVEETNDVKFQIAVKDQYQNKLAQKAGLTFGETGKYEIKIKDTNSVVAYDSISSVKGEDKVYEIKLKAKTTANIYKTGSFTVQLEDDGKIVASQLFNLVVTKKISSYGIDRDKGTYKAGDAIKVDVNAYSGSSFNAYYTGSVSARIVVSNAAVTDKEFTKTLAFKNGVASFELTAGTEANNYEIYVENQNATTVNGTSDTFNVVGNAAGKLTMSPLGVFQLTDSQGNATTGWERKAYAQFKVMDLTKGTDITGSISTVTVDGTACTLRADKTLEVSIGADNLVYEIDGNAYDLANNGIQINAPTGSSGNKLQLAITIDGFTWDMTEIGASPTTYKDTSATSVARKTAQTTAVGYLNTNNSAITGWSGSATKAAITNATVSAIKVKAVSSSVIDFDPTVCEDTQFIGYNVSGASIVVGNTATVEYVVYADATSSGTTVRVTRTYVVTFVSGTPGKFDSASIDDQWDVVEILP